MATYNFTESFDRNALFYITRNFSKVFKNPRGCNEKELKGILTSLRYYLKSSNEDGTINISYSQKSYGFGRLYANLNALQNMPCDIRNAIANKYVNDYDVVKAHPVILKHICSTKNISCPMLTDYVENREEWLVNIYPESRADSKTTIIRLMYGGDVPSNVSYQKIIEFHSELRNITIALSGFSENKKFVKIAMDKRYNQEGSFLSYLLQDMENKILRQCISYCTTQNIRIHSLIYDGFTANIDDTIDLSELSEYVRENTGFKLSFVIKPMVSTIIIPDNALDLSNRITYESVKENFEKHCAKIMNPIVFVDYDIVLSREHLKNKYENLFYHKVKKESYEQTSFISDWLKDFDMKTYQGIGLYPPPLICPENVYNTYVSYPWITYSGEESSDIEWFFNHLKLMVSNDSNAYNYVLYWIAHIIQKPGIKTETLISFVGEEGVGKSLFRKIIKSIDWR